MCGSLRLMLFDIRVTDVDVLSYLSHSVKNVLNTYTPEEVSM